MGLDFYAHTRDPYTGGNPPVGQEGIFIYTNADDITGVLVEGCKFRSYYYGANLSGSQQAGADIDIEFRRNSFLDNYGSDDNQGIFGQYVNNLLLEENIFIHNGWKVASSSDGTDRTNAQATIWNHCVYLNSTNKLTARHNLFIDPSSAGIKLTRKYQTSSTTITDNLFIGSENPISMGNNYQGAEYAYHFANVTISTNVASHGGRGNHSNRGIGWGFWLAGLDGATISNNLLINADSSVTSGQALATNSYESRNVTWDGNVVYDWGSTQGLRISNGSAGSSNIVFTNNKIQLPGLTNDYVIYADYDVRGEWSFSGNKLNADSQTFFNDASTIDLASWNSWSGDNSTWTKTSFPDATRDIDTYMASIGKTNTIDAFVAACRAQDRYSWDPRYTADVVNYWIRSGFWETMPSRDLLPPFNFRLVSSP